VTGMLRNRRLCGGHRMLQKCVSPLTRLNSGLVDGNVLNCQDSYVTRVVGSPVGVEGGGRGLI
jgi:hypothetical protein